jgi:hypothetical protein
MITIMSNLPPAPRPRDWITPLLVVGIFGMTLLGLATLGSLFAIVSPPTTAQVYDSIDSARGAALAIGAFMSAIGVTPYIVARLNKRDADSYPGIDRRAASSALIMKTITDSYSALTESLTERLSQLDARLQVVEGRLKESEDLITEFEALITQIQAVMPDLEKIARLLDQAPKTARTRPPRAAKDT